jgi:hypothetical protein
MIDERSHAIRTALDLFTDVTYLRTLSRADPSVYVHHAIDDGTHDLRFHLVAPPSAIAYVSTI